MSHSYADRDECFVLCSMFGVHRNRYRMGSNATTRPTAIAAKSPWRYSFRHLRVGHPACWSASSDATRRNR
jgi:hypothetical protein